MQSHRKATTLLILCLLHSFVGISALDPSSLKDDAKSAIDSIEKKITKFTNNAIVNKVMVYGNVAMFSAMAVKYTIALIQSLMGGPKESKELVFMREQFAIINNKLDALDYDFENVKSQIDWNVMKVVIGAYEQSIKSLETIYQDYLKAPPGASKFFQDMFITAYVRIYNDAAIKIFSALSEYNRLFQENLFKIARQYLKNHRDQISDFTGYILRIVNRGVILEHAYLLIIGQEERQKRLEEEWSKRYEKLAEVTKKVEKEIIDSWSTQFKLDSDEFTVRNIQLNNQAMSVQLHDFLAKKYYWRWFFVLTYTFTNHNDKDRYFENCHHSFVKYNVGNKVVIVNGLEKNYKKKPYPGWFLKSVTPRMRNFGAFSKVAKILFYKSSSGCHLYNFKGAFESKATPVSKGPKGAVFTRHTEILRDFHGYKGYDLFMLI